MNPWLGPCNICGKEARDLHHKDGNPFNHSAENIQELCRKCHMVVDGRLGVAIERIKRVQPLGVAAWQRKAKAKCPKLTV